MRRGLEAAAATRADTTRKERDFDGREKKARFMFAFVTSRLMKNSLNNLSAREVPA